MKVSVTFFCLVALSQLTNSQSCSSVKVEVVIICSKVETFDWMAIGIALTCSGDHHSITSTFSRSSVTFVVHSNKSEATNLAEITGLRITGATVKFIPSGIGSKFINLKTLGIWSCGLLSVKKENLKEFGNWLEEVNISLNKLKSIDTDLFEYNPNLKVIFLNDNPIRYIDEFFTNLKNLKNFNVSI